MGEKLVHKSFKSLVSNIDIDTQHLEMFQFLRINQLSQ